MPPGDLSFVLTNFLYRNENSKKNRPFFKRIIAQYAVKFHANFQANFIENSWEQRTKFAHFACITFAQYCTIFIYLVSALFMSDMGKEGSADGVV